MKNYICDSSEYTYGKGYIGLPVDVDDLPKNIYIDGKNYF